MPFLTTLTCNICNEILRRECVASMRDRVPSFLYGRVWITHRRYHRQPNFFPHFFHGSMVLRATSRSAASAQMFFLFIESLLAIFERKPFFWSYNSIGALRENVELCRKNRGLQKVQTSVPLIISTLQSGHPVRSLPYAVLLEKAS